MWCFMYVEYSGWTSERGSFHCKIFVDENKLDYELHYKSGKTAKQSSPFQHVTADWNHDGDVYTQFGAWFDHIGENGKFQGGEFWTPVEMVGALADAMDRSSRNYGDHVIAIPGIEIPPPDRRSTLDDQIIRSERRSEAQEIERNRKMNALGIRPPNEPWAR